MEAELSRAQARPDESLGIPIGEPGPATLEAVAAKSLPVLSRCPYCREDVRTGGAPWVACEGCLARHHTSCWDEHGSCASCQTRVALERRGKARADAGEGVPIDGATVGVGDQPEKAKTTEAPDQELAAAAANETKARNHLLKYQTGLWSGWERENFETLLEVEATYRKRGRTADKPEKKP